MKGKKQGLTRGEPIAWTNPFAALKNRVPLPGLTKQSGPDQTEPTRPTAQTHRGRVDIIRQKAHRGGKTVTVVSGFIGIGLAEKVTLAKEMQRSCGAGGTVKDGRIEIQGDQRETVARILSNAGFHPVFAGG